MEEETEAAIGNRFWYFPYRLRNTTPHIMVHKYELNYSFVIPKCDIDSEVSCVSTGKCFLFMNRGYYCKKHNF